MKFKRPKLIPLFIALSVMALVSFIFQLHLDLPERLERVTYDLRVRAAQHFPVPVATNLAFVSIEESSIQTVKNGKYQGHELGYQFGLLWPRQVYGRLVDELNAEGAEVVGFDVLFGELRTDHPPVLMADGQLEESDVFFAHEMAREGRVVLAVTPEVFPPRLFVTNAYALGDISTEKDGDGILRRVRAFRDFRCWHPIIEQFANDPEIQGDLLRAQLLPGKIMLPQIGTTNLIEIPVDAQTNFTLADFVGEKQARRMPLKAPAFTERRIWHMGIILAARQLKLDLAKAEVDLAHRKITLRGAGGLERVIPVDKRGFFMVDWRLTPNDAHLTRVPVEFLLWQDQQRLLGQTNGLLDVLRGKIVVVGSAVQGNDLTDRGATPLEHDTLLVSKHWNVANSVITGRFIQKATPGETIWIIVLLGCVAAFLTWQLRAITASLTTIGLIAGYTVFAFYVFIQHRIWLPLVFPVVGAILVEHISLVTYRVMFEEREQRRVKSVFSKIVAPTVVNELLGTEKLSLGGTRREITVLFADVRGFTTLTDQVQEQIAEFVRTNKLDTAAAEKCFDESARETLETVNLYLSAVANAVKQHGGTLDKYIGDCVMAFWNAPIEDSNHAEHCVRAAIDAQQAIAQLNQQRLARNVDRELENRARASAGLPPRPMLVALELGTGINTGMATVGLMGSDQHILNYTVFGREVNLASRLEGVSGSGRIFISETTYAQLFVTAPALAAICKKLVPVTLKGIRNAVPLYEVPWK